MAPQKDEEAASTTDPKQEEQPEAEPAEVEEADELEPSREVEVEATVEGGSAVIDLGEFAGDVLGVYRGDKSLGFSVEELAVGACRVTVEKAGQAGSAAFAIQLR